MKKSIILSLVALMFSAVSFAQEAPQNEQPQERKAPTVEEIAKRRADRMRNELLLGNDQYDKVYKLCLAQAKKDKARQEAVKAEKEAFNKDMKKILNEAQSERYDHMQRPRWNNRRGPQARGPQHRPQFGPGQKAPFQNPPFELKKGGKIEPSREEIMRKRKMFDDVQQQPEQAPQADAEVNMSDLAANDNIMTNVISLDMMASVEADLLG